MGFVAWQAWWLSSPMEYQVVRRVGPISLVFTQERAPIRAVGAIQGFQPHRGKHQLPQFPLPLASLQSLCLFLSFCPQTSSSHPYRPYPESSANPFLRVPHILKTKSRLLRPLPGLPANTSYLNACASSHGPAPNSNKDTRPLHCQQTFGKNTRTGEISLCSHRKKKMSLCSQDS